MTYDCSGVDLKRGRLKAPARGHLEAVVDDFLPAVSKAQTQAPVNDAPILVAAPGGADTCAILTLLMAKTSAGQVYDLGGNVEARLGRWERDRRLARHASGNPVLFWCPMGNEGLSLSCSLALGRVGAMLRPHRLVLLWFAGQNHPSGREPAATQRELAVALAQAAVPAARINLYCLGWLGDPRHELSHLAQRFG